MMNFMQGKLTYTVAIIAILYGVGGYLMGWVDSATATNVVWSGLAVFGLRRAVANQ